MLDLPEKHPLDWKQKLQLALDTASGLSYLHRKGHTHGDIKSHTLLCFESQGRLRVKVAEFGQPRCVFRGHTTCNHSYVAHNPRHILPTLIYCTGFACSLMSHLRLTACTAPWLGRHPRYNC